MWTTLLSAFSPLLFKLVGYVVMKIFPDTATQQKYFDFVSASAANGALSVKLRAEFLSQKERILKKLQGNNQ